MTSHAKVKKMAKKEKTEEQKAKVREQARLRKQKQRNKAKVALEQGESIGSNLTGKISSSELEQLKSQAIVRGFDCTTEYLMTLMRIDGERIKHDQSAIGTCNSCNLPLPDGCNTAFKGQFDCSYIQGLPLVSLKADSNEG